ncbi:MAG: tripartite tricarboxylate transporter TctB family protein [Gammaproteobacteria bacterium]|nr:tripartite tricarboxylate transporter TctB family protein [Gammaproteobacteria bacterium]MYF59945.1 tripartite tricarboxylate transporter TctB family protein [Gammaproteobacteria bacterium]
MRFLFSMALLAFSLSYTGYALYSLDLLDRADRLGPGFFPAIVGVLLIATTAANAIREYRRQREAATALQPLWRDVAEVTGLIALFLALLPYAGSLLTILAFTFLYLYRFNRVRGWFNAVYAVAFSAAVYLLFEVVLQAGLPQGVLAPLY